MFTSNVQEANDNKGNRASHYKLEDIVSMYKVQDHFFLLT